MPETDGSSKSPARAAFASGCIGRNPETRLAGWRRSANHPLLCLSFPANREFYREFSKIAAAGHLGDTNLYRGAEFSSKFPSNKNRELFLTSREFRGSNRDVRSPLESGHVRCKKADICSAIGPVRPKHSSRKRVK